MASPLLRLLFALATCLWLASSSLATINYLKEKYSKVERKIAGRVRSQEDFDANIELALKYFRRSAGCFIVDDSMLAAGKRFAQLKELTSNQEMCSSEGYDRLATNFNLTEGLPTLRGIFWAATKRHGEFCERFLAEQAAAKLHKELRNIGGRKEIFAMAERLSPQLFGGMHLAVALGEAERGQLKLYELLEGLKFDPELDYREAVHSVMMQLKETSYKEYVNSYRSNFDNGSAAEAALRTWIVNSCNILVNLVGPKYFELAAMDTKAMGRDLSSADKLVSVNQIYQFYLYWTSYRICQIYVLPAPDNFIEQVRRWAVRDKVRDWEREEWGL